jgi:hypothetical protein
MPHGSLWRTERTFQVKKFGMVSTQKESKRVANAHKEHFFLPVNESHVSGPCVIMNFTLVPKRETTTCKLVDRSRRRPPIHGQGNYDGTIHLASPINVLHKGYVKDKIKEGRSHVYKE